MAKIVAVDTGCPWCGEKLIQEGESQQAYEMQMEGHAMECETFLQEMGGGL